MPPKLKGEVPLKLDDGRSFTLTFNEETLFAAEVAYGRPLHVLLPQLQAEMWGAVRAFLFAGLRPAHPEITMEDCSKMLLSGGIQAVGASVSAGLDAALPDAAEGKDGANPPANGRAGKSAGANGAKRGSTRKPSGKAPRARSKSSSARA